MPYQVRSTGRWAAQGRDEDGKRIALGTFASREDALAAEVSGKRPDRDKFWSRVTAGGPDECWNWSGRTNNKGYGRLRGSDTLAHRWSYEIHVGPIPEGHVVHHRCENTLCVNPAHLETTTQDRHMAWHQFDRRRAAFAESARVVLTIAPPAGLTRAAARVDLAAAGV